MYSFHLANALVRRNVKDMPMSTDGVRMPQQYGDQNKHALERWRVARARGLDFSEVVCDFAARIGLLPPHGSSPRGRPSDGAPYDSADSALGQV
jgi:hypothetical protein